jgi:dTDP-4-amino-4,6-dideoxygalactose transaminase
MGLSHGGAAGMCPVTERIADELIRLPLYNDLEDADQTRVIEAVRSFT